MHTLSKFAVSVVSKLCSPISSFWTRYFPRHEACWGISLPSWGRKKLEFWYAPAGYEIKEHSHPNQDIELTILFAHNVWFCRRRGSFIFCDHFYARYWNIGKTFTISAGDNHSFKVSKWPLIFMSRETWKDGVEITSAATDFQLSGK
jgi:hypothetical protein